MRSRLARFDPGLAELRRAWVAMAAVLATYACALLIEHQAGLHVDIVILAIVLAMTTARIQRAAGPADRLIGLAVLPAAAVAAAGISRLMSVHPNAGDALFVTGMFVSVWVRRFGPHATRAGTLLMAPLVAVLIMPPSGLPGPGTLWVAVIGLIASVWVSLLQLLAYRTGLAVPPHAPAAARPPVGARAGKRIGVSTRMALQMATALAAAFAIGRTIWPGHWAWVVLTAFIVCSGARGRGDVLLKGTLRGAGAAAGTAVATALAGTFGPHADASVVVMFAALAVATWLREFSYAWWAACVTAVLSLLYGWFGQAPGGLLETRLEGIAVGAALGIAASWLILPVRTGDVARRRAADALAALSGVLTADWRDPDAVGHRQAAFQRTVISLGQIAPPLRAQRLLLAPLQGTRPGATRLADVIEAIESCAQPVGCIVVALRYGPEAAGTPCVARLNKAVIANITVARLAIGRRPGAAYRAAVPGTCAAAGLSHDGTGDGDCREPAGCGQLAAALTGIDRALNTVCTAFGRPAEEEPAPPVRQDGPGFPDGQSGSANATRTPDRPGPASLRGRVQFQQRPGAGKGVYSGPLPAGRGEQLVVGGQFAFLSGGDGQHAHVEQRGEPVPGEIADDVLDHDQARARPGGFPAVSQDAHAGVVVPVVEHGLEQVQVGGGYSGEEIAGLGGEPGTEAFRLRCLPRRLDRVREVKYEAVQPVVDAHQLADQLPGSPSDVDRKRHPAGIDDLGRVGRDRPGEGLHRGGELCGLLRLPGQVVKQAGAEHGWRLRSALANGLRQLPPRQPVPRSPEGQGVIAQRPRDSGLEQRARGRHRKTPVTLIREQAKPRAGAHQPVGRVRIAGLEVGHVLGRPGARGEVIGKPQVGGGAHYLAIPVAVDHPKQRHRMPVAEALVLLGACLLGVRHVGLSHDPLAPWHTVKRRRGLALSLRMLRGRRSRPGAGRRMPSLACLTAHRPVGTWHEQPTPGTGDS